jgi:DNA repair photolyase
MSKSLVIPVAALKGRGTAWAIEHRYTADPREVFDDGWGTQDQIAEEEHLPPQTQVVEETVKSIVTRNDSPDVPFELSINPYRGCEHGCIYCFARPTHSYLNLSPGLDFETRLIAKVNAAERLRETLALPSYRVSPVNIGSATDAYQPIERSYRITRAVLEVLCETKHPFSIISKSAGMERDIDLIAPMAAAQRAAVYISITTLDPQLARVMEPRAAAPQRRLQAVRRLTQAGIPVGVSISPIIPFINEPEIERIVDAAADAGAYAVFSVVLRLPWEVNPLFQDWLQQHFPDRAARVMARVREMRGGRDYASGFGQRMKGSGVWAQLIAQRLSKAAARCGIDQPRRELDCTQFGPPVLSADNRQAPLF